MKLKHVEKAGEKDRFVLHINREETKIIIALLTKARTYTPRVEQTVNVLGRIRNMERVLREGMANG